MNLSKRYSAKLAEREAYSLQDLNGILVQLELTNACNHKCVFCPNKHHTRRTRMMDYELARRIIEECATFLGKDKRICFHMNGEPLLYDRLVELVTLSKQQGYDYIFLTTNGTLATDELLKSLFDAGLDSIKFSINAGTPETYRKVHKCGKDDYYKVMHALKFAYEYRKTSKKEFKIFVSCVGIKDNYDELTDLQNKVQPLCDEIVFYHPCTYAGQKSVSDLKCDLSNLNLNVFEIKHNVPCPVLWNSINVTAEGYLALCCSEADNRLILEDISQQSIYSSWQGTKMSEIRRKHLEMSIDDTPCAACVYGVPYERRAMNKELFQLALSKLNEGVG